MSSSGASIAAQPVMAGEGVSRYLDEDVSWIESGARVLALAEEEAGAPLERVGMLAAAARGLDEMFQLRGAQRRPAVSVGGPQRAVRLRVQELMQRQVRALRRLGPVLAAHGICPCEWEALGTRDRGYLADVFRQRVLPALAPLVTEPGRPLPPPADLSLNVAVRLRDEDGRNRFGSIELPPVLPRFLTLADGRPVPVEQLVVAHLPSLFAPFQVSAHGIFRVTRQAGLPTEPAAEDLLAATELQLSRDRSGTAVRLEVDASMPDDLMSRLVNDLDLVDADVYVVHGLLGLASLRQLSDLDRPELKASHPVAVTPTRLAPVGGDRPDPFAVVEGGDLLVHAPYDSPVGSVDVFVARAANDPEVLAVKHTLYRPAPDGSVVRSLARAAERGVHVVVLVELAARLGERDSAACARALERSGAHVVYGLVGVRTHCPVALVVAQRAAGVTRYSMVSTITPDPGARVEGMSLLSADGELGADLSDVFNYLTGYSRPNRFRRLLVAPVSLRAGLLDHVREQATPEGRIRIKVNRLVDREVIDALYAASQKGAEIDLVVAGACALRPGVTGLSSTIRVVAPTGWYRESSKVFSFGTGDGMSLYLSSADLAVRNLDRQVDVAVPVSDPTIRRRLEATLDVHLELPGWELGPDGAWRRSTAPPSQQEVEDRLAALAAGRPS
ncbi:MAG: RNA degradosome polyphosphate kinase [Actinomycetota bacterium]|nr:RNA degradosome polyphosphate kinase [Actinomycetota bacterium]